MSTTKSTETTNKDGTTITTQKESSIKASPDGTTIKSNSEATTSVKSEIKLDSNTKVKVSEVDAEQDEDQYIEAIKKKGHLAILKDTNHYICNLKLKMFENILKKIGTNLSDEINLIAFGIYTMEEINKRQSLVLEVPVVKLENITRYLEIKEPEIIRVKENEKKLDNNIFINIQAKIDFIKAEEERKRKEEEERKRKIEEENRIQMELKNKKREKGKLKLKQIREENIREILMKKFNQYRNNIKALKIVETKKKTETEKKVLRLKIKKEPKNKVDEEAEKKKKEEEEKRLKEEEEKKRKEEEERKRKEEEEKRLKEEEERKKKEEEERKKKEEEEKRLKEEEEKKKKEEEERKRKEEEEKKKKEEEKKEKERLRLEEEARKKKEEEEKEKERLKQEIIIQRKAEEERVLKEKEEKLENERLLKEKEEEEKRRLESEKSKPSRQEKSNIESTTIEIKEETTSTLRATNKKSDEENNIDNNINNNKDNNINSDINNNKDNNTSSKKDNNIENDNMNDNNSNKIEEIKIKEEKESEQNEESSGTKPKKKKVIKKVKKIVKIPKKKSDIIDNRKPFYISGSTSVSGGGGFGHYYENITYTGRIPKCHFSSSSQCDCGNCQNKYSNEKITQSKNINIYKNSNSNSNKKEKNNNNLLICENCVHKLNQFDENDNESESNNFDRNNNGNKNIRTYEYYQNLDDGKYDPVNTKEFYEMNRNRYLSELWKKENDGIPYGKKGVKSKSIERVKKVKFNDDNEFDRYINGFTTERYGIKDDNSEINSNIDYKNNNNANRIIKRCRNNSTEIMRQSYRLNGNNDNNNINNVKMINGMNNLEKENDNDLINNKKVNLRIRKNQYYNTNDDLNNNNLINDENININNNNNNNTTKKILINNSIIYKPELKELDCPQCKNSYVITRDIRFYHCSDCKNIMCGKCSKEHYLRYPEHNCSNTDIHEIITNISYEIGNANNRNYDHIKNDINNSLQTKEAKKRKINVRKYINKSQTQNQNQENNIGNINDENLNLENNNNNELLLLRNKKDINNNDYINNINNFENGGDYNYDDCFLCGIKQRENIQDKFYICRECDRLLCQNCRIKHDKINPEHNLVISYISGEINNDDNKDSIKNIDQTQNQQFQCIHCQNKMRNNNINDINGENIRYNYINNNENDNINMIINNEENNNMNNNMNIKLRKEKINQNIQSMQINQNNQKLKLDNNNISYQFELKSYPYDNDDKNMKTQYQHDYDDKYNLYRNLMNISNEKMTKENNNNEYFNPIKEYDNTQEAKNINKVNNININQMQNIKNINKDIDISNNNIKIKRNEYCSPLKKKKLIKRYDNNNVNNAINFENNEQNEYNDEYKNEYKKETINELNLQLKEKNLDSIKKRKCKIEFDLNKDETEFDTCEIFGNPVCYNCLKSKKDEKNFKIFYCSQCMKLFCKDCLYQHNYI